MRNTVDPGSQGTFLLENLQTPPQFKVNLLQQIATLVRVSLKASDQSLQCWAERCNGEGIAIILIHTLASINQLLVLPVSRRARRILTDIAKIYRRACIRVGPTLKFYLRGGQELSLLCIGGRRIVLFVRSVNEYAHMNSTNLITRVGQGLLAIAATGATLLALQIAMLA